MSPDIFPYIVILVPLALIVGLSLFFYRLFTKSAKKDKEFADKMRKLQELKNIAEFKSARIVSVQPYQTSMYAPGQRTVNLRLEIEESPGNFKSHSVTWMIDTYFSSAYQIGDNIQVKVYGEHIFPTQDGAKLLPS